ncbi:MAG: hypothetical protein LBS41_00820 [Streptococcaceae bacterium]|jgi:hypothetical protein|nr:hypothetical protein [Streptococcaceae bacterium]
MMTIKSVGRGLGLRSTEYTVKVLMRMRTRAKHDAPVQSHWRSWKSGKKWLCGVSIFLGVLLIGVGAVPTLEEGAESVICRILRWMRVSAATITSNWIQKDETGDNAYPTDEKVAEGYARATGYADYFNIRVVSATGVAEADFPPAVQSYMTGYYLPHVVITPGTSASPAFSGVFKKTTDLDTHDKLLAAGYTLTSNNEILGTRLDLTEATTIKDQYVGVNLTEDHYTNANFRFEDWEAFSLSGSQITFLQQNGSSNGNLNLQPAVILEEGQNHPNDLKNFSGAYTYEGAWDKTGINKDDQGNPIYPQDISQEAYDSYLKYVENNVTLSVDVDKDTTIQLRLGAYISNSFYTGKTNTQLCSGFFPVYIKDDDSDPNNDKFYTDDIGNTLVLITQNLNVGNSFKNYVSLSFVFGGGMVSQQTRYEVTAPIYTRPEIPETSGTTTTTYDYKYAYGDKLLPPTVVPTYGTPTTIDGALRYPKTISGVAKQQLITPLGAYQSGGEIVLPQGTQLLITYTDITGQEKTANTTVSDNYGNYTITLTDAQGGTKVTVTPNIQKKLTGVTLNGVTTTKNTDLKDTSSNNLYARSPAEATLQVQGRFIPVDSSNNVITAIDASDAKWAFGPVDKGASLTDQLPTVTGYTRVTTSATAPNIDGNINVIYTQNPNRVVPVDATTGATLSDIPSQPDQYPDENGNVTVPDLSSYGYSLAASVVDADSSKEGIQVPADLTDGLTEVPYTRNPLPLPVTGYVGSQPLSFFALLGAAVIALIASLQYAIAKLDKRHKD